MLKRFNGFLGNYGWIILIVFLLIITTQLSEANEHLGNIWDNVAEIETTNKHLDTVTEQLDAIEINSDLLNDIESNTSPRQSNLY